MSDFRHYFDAYAEVLSDSERALYDHINKQPALPDRDEITLRQALKKLDREDKILSHITSHNGESSSTTGCIAVFLLRGGVPLEHIKAIVGVMS